MAHIPGGKFEFKKKLKGWLEKQKKEKSNPVRAASIFVEKPICRFDLKDQGIRLEIRTSGAYVRPKGKDTIMSAKEALGLDYPKKFGSSELLSKDNKLIKFDDAHIFNFAEIAPSFEHNLVDILRNQNGHYLVFVFKDFKYLLIGDNKLARLS